MTRAVISDPRFDVWAAGWLLTREGTWADAAHAWTEQERLEEKAMTTAHEEYESGRAELELLRADLKSRVAEAQPYKQRRDEARVAADAAHKAEWAAAHEYGNFEREITRRKGEITRLKKKLDALAARRARRRIVKQFTR